MRGEGLRVTWLVSAIVIGGVEHLPVGAGRPVAGTVVKLRCGALYRMSTHRKTIVGRCAGCFGRRS